MIGCFSYDVDRFKPDLDCIANKDQGLPANVRAAHDINYRTPERIYIGRRFKNVTERLEKLFEMYTRMTTKVPA
jgi:hypothetical protein